MMNLARPAILIIFLSASVLATTPYSFARMPGSKQGNADKDDAYTWDLGRMEENSVIKRSFYLKNESGRTWHIGGINTSCGCTGTEIKNRTLLPGQSTEAIVSFNSRGYSPGPLKQYIYVNTDDPENPVLKFTVKVEVVVKGGK